MFMTHKNQIAEESVTVPVLRLVELVETEDVMRQRASLPCLNEINCCELWKHPRNMMPDQIVPLESGQRFKLFVAIQNHASFVQRQRRQIARST
jgi:hypothetical protein